MNRRVFDKRPTIGIILPMLSGFYMGELNATLRQMAKQHGVNLVFIRSGHRRDFDLSVALHHLDALMVVLHSASDHLVQTALSKGIPVLSLGASYAPLNVEQFISIQSDGVKACIAGCWSKDINALVFVVICRSTMYVHVLKPINMLLQSIKGLSIPKISLALATAH